MECDDVPTGPVTVPPQTTTGGIELRFGCMPTRLPGALLPMFDRFAIGTDFDDHSWRCFDQAQFDPESQPPPPPTDELPATGSTSTTIWLLVIGLALVMAGGAMTAGSAPSRR